MAKHAFAAYDTTAANNTDVGAINIAENCDAANINNAIREVMSHGAEHLDDLKGYTSTGTGAAYVVATTNSHFAAANDGALAQIHILAVNFHTANTSTTSTLAVDSLAATTIVDKDGGALVVGELLGLHLVRYNGTNFQIVGALDESSPDDLITTRGDIITGNSSAAAARLALGTDGQVLASDGTDAAWTSGYSRIATGTYTGDGALSKAITGLGFQPKAVGIIVASVDGGAGQLIITTDTLVTRDPQGLVLSILGTGVTNLDGRIRSLDSDGFTVGDDGADANPNSNGTTYDWVAWG